MARPPKAPEIVVDKTTHHSIEASWEPYLLKLQAKLKEEDGRLRVEVQVGRSEDSWEVAYKGHDVRCVLSDLSAETDYLLRFRFGNGGAWGEFSNPRAVRTLKKPFSGQDIHRHIRLKDAEGLRRILETGEAHVDAPDDRGFTPLTVAALAEQLALCELLVEFGADVNAAGDNGKTPLMLVACKGKPEVLTWLLDQEAKVSLRDRRGMSALHYAVDGEQLEMVRKLLGRDGEQVQSRDNQGCTPLIRCAMLKNNGNAGVAAALLKGGARVDETDASGQSALFYCALNRHAKMAAVLLEANADPHSTNKQGVSVMKVAEAQDHRGIASMLKERASKK